MAKGAHSSRGTRQTQHFCGSFLFLAHEPVSHAFSFSSFVIHSLYSRVILLKARDQPTLKVGSGLARSQLLAFKNGPKLSISPCVADLFCIRPSGDRSVSLFLAFKPQFSAKEVWFSAWESTQGFPLQRLRALSSRKPFRCASGSLS